MPHTRSKSAYHNVPASSLYNDYSQDVYDDLPYARDNDICNPQYLSQRKSQLIRVFRYDTAPYRIPSEKNKDR